jgi:segregation and condensation protein B
MEPLLQHIESLIFASEDPITIKEMKAVLEEVLGTPFKKNEIEEALAELQEVYAQEDRSLEIVEIAGGFQML